LPLDLSYAASLPRVLIECLLWGTQQIGAANKNGTRGKPRSAAVDLTPPVRCAYGATGYASIYRTITMQALCQDIAIIFVSGLKIKTTIFLSEAMITIIRKN